MLKYLLPIIFIGVMTVMLHARNSGASYAILNKSYSTITYATDNVLRTASMPVTPPAKTTNISHAFIDNNYLASVNSQNIFSATEVLNVDYRLINQQVKSFSKSSLHEPAQVMQNKSMTDLSTDHFNPRYPSISYDVWNFFNGSDHGQQFLVGCKIWGGIGFGMMGVLMAMPRTITRWQDDYLQDAVSNLEDAYSEAPVWDEDHWEINYVGHPYAGSLYYNTIRAQGGNALQSFVFSAFISTSWEYLFEATAEQPSIQDLIVTPIAGAIIGELTHQATLHMQKNGYNIVEKICVTIINPMHVLINGYR